MAKQSVCPPKPSLPAETSQILRTMDETSTHQSMSKDLGYPQVIHREVSQPKAKSEP
jgi:hypothetical protein